MILDLDIEVLAERRLHFQSERLGFIVFPRQKKARDTPRETGGEADDPVGVFLQYGIVDARTVVVPVHKGEGVELDQIDVTRLVFGKQDEVVRLLIDVLAVVVHDVKLTPDDGFDLVLFALLGKFQRGVHIAVIGHGNGVDVVVHAVTDEVVHLDRAVEEAVFCVKVQVYEIGHGCSPEICMRRRMR